MIARLHGRLVGVETDAVVVDVNGVGYRVHVPAQLLQELGPEGASVTLHTHLVVRESEWLLVGSTDPDGIAVFELLLGVSGVGPRVALALLSTLDTGELRRAIVQEDIVTITRAPGVGRRLAERICLELRGKVEPGDAAAMAAGALSGVQGEALEALVSLGYTRAEARQALAASQSGLPPEADLEQRVVAALRALSD